MLKKKDLITLSADRCGLPKSAVEKAFDAILEVYREQLVTGEAVPFGDLGKFQITERAARAGRNPATGAAIEIPASKNVRFKAGKALVEAINP
jgi:DNA-binding protein HU-beta